MFKVKTLTVLFPLYPREMKTNTRNLNLPPFCRLFVSMEMVQPIPTRALSRERGLSMRTGLTAVDSRVLCLGADQKARGLWERDCRQPIIWRMAAILRDSTVVAVAVAVAVAVVRTRPRAIPLAMITRMSIHGFPLVSYVGMGLRLAALRAAGAPLIFRSY